MLRSLVWRRTSFSRLWPNLSCSTMSADGKDFITPHITDSHHLEYPCLDTGWVCSYELPHWDPIQIGAFAIDISPTKHVVMLWIAALLCIAMMLGALRGHKKKTEGGRAPKGLANGLEDRKSTRLNSSHSQISYAVFC